MWFTDVLFKACFIILRKIKKQRKNCESCPSQVTWIVKFKCQIFLFSLTCLSCLSRYLGCPVCLHGYDNHDDNDDHDHDDPNDHDRGYLIPYSLQSNLVCKAVGGYMTRCMVCYSVSEICRYSAARAAKIIFLYPVIFVVAFSRSVTSFSLAALREAAKYYLGDFFR